jgi:hypothetical protein
VFSDTIVDALDDSGSAKHAGFEEKEARRARRQARLAKAGVAGIAGKGKARVKANPESVFSWVCCRAGADRARAARARPSSCTRRPRASRRGSG